MMGCTGEWTFYEEEALFAQLTAEEQQRVLEHSQTTLAECHSTA